MRDDRGYTLIEVVVALAILVAIMLSIFSFYVTGVKGFARESTTAYNQMKIRRALNDISREVRRSSSATVGPGSLVLEYSDDKKTEFSLSGDSIIMNYFEKNPSGVYMDMGTSTLIDGIKSFTSTIGTEVISIELESTANSEGQTYKRESKLTIR